MKTKLPRQTRTVDELVTALQQSGSSDRKAGMARYGIRIEHALGVSMPAIRAIGSTTRKDHQLALSLWNVGIHEARILASLIDEPNLVTREQCEKWALDFNSWDLVDQVTGNLFDRTSLAEELVFDWSHYDAEFTKRAAFSLIAWMAVHRKKDPDEMFLPYLSVIEREAHDSRNFVRKAVNWSLRQIGKRSATLHEPALILALKLQSQGDKTRSWIGSDAAKELQSEKVRTRLRLS